MPTWEEQQEPFQEEVEESELPSFEPAARWMAQDYPEPGYVIPGLIQSEASGAIVAPSFTGKTLLAVKLLIETARLGYPCGYVMEEGTAYDFKARLLACGLEEYLLDQVGILFQQGARLDERKWLKHLETQLTGMAVCFFDTFSDVTEVDPLDPRAMVRVFKGIRSLRIATACSPVVVMHTPKAVFRNDTPPSLADVFGSVTAVNVLDFVHLLRPLEVKAQRQEDDDSQELADAAAKRMSAGRIEVHTRKLRGCALPPPRVGQIVESKIVNGRTYSSAHFQWVEGFTLGQAKQAAKVEAVREAIMRHVKDFDCPSANKVNEGLKGWRRVDVLQAVKDMLLTGQLTRDLDGNIRPEVVPGSGGSQVVPENLGTVPRGSTGGVVPGPISLGPEPPSTWGSISLSVLVNEPETEGVVPMLDEVLESVPAKKSITCLAMVDGRVCGWPTVQGLPYCAKHPHGQVESRP